MPRTRFPEPPIAPLYDPRFEHDACGVGFVAESSGRRSTRVVSLAIEALAGLTHRGAVAADARTGDGAGIAIAPPPRFVRRVLEEIGVAAPTGRVALGMFFLPLDEGANAVARSLVADAIAAEGLEPLGWRAVPVRSDDLAPAAAASRPDVAQLAVASPEGMGRQSFERALFFARRSIEHLVLGSDPDLAQLHVAALSTRTLVYKGLFVGAELGRFFVDLADPDLASTYAVFHQRYSTNTHPSWRLAQPFRYLAHNGEINTVRGNRDAMRGRAAQLGGGQLGRRLARETAAGRPMLDPDGSDSASLDEAIELLVVAGYPIEAAVLGLVPEALGLRDEAPADLVAFQAAMAARIEPWDGPAALVFADGHKVGAILDRNGLRPAAYEVHRDGLVILASEAGTLRFEADRVVRRGRLGPGELFLVDPGRREVLDDAEAKRVAVARARVAPVPAVASTGPISQASTGPSAVPTPAPSQAEARQLEAVASATPAAGHHKPVVDDTTARRRLLFGLDAEQARIVIRPMATNGREPIWSMGDDTPLAVAARRPRAAASYLRQSFAQVTNPPIDPERERVVLSLAARLGSRPRLLDRMDRVGRARHSIALAGPIVGSAGLDGLEGAATDLSIVTLDATWSSAEGTGGLRRAIARLTANARREARRGADLLVIDDRSASGERAPVPAVIAVGAVHSALVSAGMRSETDILAVAGDALDVHAVAMILAAGASAVQPWLLVELAREAAGTRGAEELTPERAEANLVAALEHGLRKVLARMGISTLASYRGGGQFETLGLDEEVSETCFPAAPHFLGATGFERLGEEVLNRHRRAFEAEAAPALLDPGFVRYRADGEFHSFAPVVIKAAQALASPPSLSAGPGAALALEAETASIDERLATYRAALARPEPALVRDLLVFRRPRRSLPLERVEPATAIVRRFVSSAMSLGSLSPEAHQTLALGMRRLGGASNTGEGGEDPAWYEPDENGDVRESAIKQVASARFGVTAEYLARAEQLEIKMAQGSKPGEGGQLPGIKATAFIAALRRGRPGMTMISPPPHHDIYSIEDLAQLIADLRAINPTARIGVKLVAGAGVGTIAAGVAKAHADYVLISGHAGGTGASPLSSIKQVGLPWELGIAEAHQVLVRQGLRDRVALRVDGGLQTGADVVGAALLGAEEFGFGTSALVALGCDMARQCHLDTCPTGIATQRPDLRAKFTGTPEAVVAYFTAIAEDVRRELAWLGFARLEEAVGRTDRLAAVDDAPLAVSALCEAPPWRLPASRLGQAPKDRGRLAEAPAASVLDERLAAAMPAQLEGLAGGGPWTVTAPITTAERSVGASLSGTLARSAAWTPSEPASGEQGGIELQLTGAAGQSLGAFLHRRLRLVVEGVANDYVGKGLSGGTLVVRPAAGARFSAEHQAIAGNTCLYGATSGRLHLLGRAGMRFAVRNSGAEAVVEGVGAHGCEYMTNGFVVVLGPTGRNFGAGMTGGVAFVYDPDGRAPGRTHAESVRTVPLDEAIRSREDGEALEARLRDLVVAQALEGSELATRLLSDWEATRRSFWLVEPRPD